MGGSESSQNKGGCLKGGAPFEKAQPRKSDSHNTHYDNKPTQKLGERCLSTGLPVTHSGVASSTPHHSAMKSVIAVVMRLRDAILTRSSKP